MPRSLPLAVPGRAAVLAPAGVLAGLLIAASALAVGTTGPLHPVQAEAASLPSALPSVLPSASASAAPATAVVTRERRASRTGRTALRPVRWVHREVTAGAPFTGKASWYGGAFAGRRTASGEVFDPDELTAASRTLPLGTRLRVCRAERCVVVRINDRGPYVDGRVLDLSRAARDRLGGFGVARVTATPVERRRVAVRPPAPRPAAVPRSASVEPSALAVPAPAAPVVEVASTGRSRQALSIGVLVVGGLLAAGSAVGWVRTAPVGWPLARGAS